MKEEPTKRRPRYGVRDGWITGDGVPRPLCANRALFCGNTDVQVLAGDLPVIRLAHGRRLLGALRLYVSLPGGPRFLQEADRVSMAYRASQVVWTVRDAAFPGTLWLELGVPGDALGYVLRVRAENSGAPLRLGWQYGGFQTLVKPAGSGRRGWNVDIVSDPEVTRPDLCLDGAPDNRFQRRRAADKESWKGWEKPGNPAYITAPAGESGVTPDGWLEGSCELGAEPLYWTVGLHPMPEGGQAFAAAQERADGLRSRIVSQTPDPFLDTALGVLAAEVDGAWYPPRTMHGSQVYNIPFLGWCNRFGNAYLGWWDRVEAELAYYASRQNGPSRKTGFSRDPKHLNTVMSERSRLYGEGHIDTDQRMYNMQSQFFDQMIAAWRMRGGGELEKWLYPALEGHTRWQDACFDPDGDGLYESYINTWPTDSVWYNGGGSCEETCYAYTAHQAAEELAQRHGNAESAAYHRGVLERIRRGFFDRLWIREKGYPGMMRERGGHERLHESAWQYNSFLPVNAGLLDRFEAAMTVWYSKWALENVELPYGGRTVWMSNWVPSIWSVRKIGDGENFQQALAFFRAGFPDEGWDLLRGHMLLCDFDRDVPGGIRSEAASLLARAVVGGLHGYAPDYPNGRVLLAPQYPAAWDRAAIATSYLETQYRRTPRRLAYRFRLEQPAEVTVRLPLWAESVEQVRGGSGWRLLPGFGTAVLELSLGVTDAGEIEVELGEAWCPAASLRLEAKPLTPLLLEAADVEEVVDPQQVLQQAQVQDGGVRLLPGNCSGTHLLFLRCRRGEMPYDRLVELALAPTAEEEEQRRKERLVPAGQGETYQPVDIRGALTADIRTIFRQTYRSPRPQGVSLGIGSDGFSPWTFTYWGKGAPEIALDDARLAAGEIRSPLGIPFLWNGGAANVAFTSLWDNWPAAVTVPVGRRARRIYLLLAGSSNPMQCHIANAVCRFAYADGTEETLPVEHPRNFWSLCGYEGEGGVAGQDGTGDYDYAADGYCLPETPPEQIRLGSNCRAVVLSWELRADRELRAVTLETLSQEVVIGLMGVTLLTQEGAG